jgi:Cu+-exporting ATPase
MQVDETKAAAESEHQGQRYYFCSSMCKEKFEQDPERYIKAMRQSPQSE